MACIVQYIIMEVDIQGNAVPVLLMCSHISHTIYCKSQDNIEIFHEARSYS